jgi:polyphosphate glucokinase
MPSSATTLLGFDVGGSSIKAGLVDISRGDVVGTPRSIQTPSPSTPDSVLKALATADREFGASGPVGFAFPSAIKQGIARTAANVDKAWIGFSGGARLSQLIGRPVVFINDADAAGIAEIEAGAGKGVRGVVILLTFGTGIGAALFTDGKLVPNTELGHLELHGFDAEKRASARVRTEEKLDWPAWCERVNDYLAHVQALFWPDLFIIGGSVSEHFDQFGPLLHNPAEIRRAVFAGQAGIVGAAFAAARNTP